MFSLSKEKTSSLRVYQIVFALLGLVLFMLSHIDYIGSDVVTLLFEIFSRVCIGISFILLLIRTRQHKGQSGDGSVIDKRD